MLSMRIKKGKKNKVRNKKEKIKVYVQGKARLKVNSADVFLLSNGARNAC
jgi:hypothetical protein